MGSWREAPRPNSTVDVVAPNNDTPFLRDKWSLGRVNKAAHCYAAFTQLNLRRILLLSVTKNFRIPPSRMRIHLPAGNWSGFICAELRLIWKPNYFSVSTVSTYTSIPIGLGGKTLNEPQTFLEHADVNTNPLTSCIMKLGFKVRILYLEINLMSSKECHAMMSPNDLLKICW